MSDSSDSKGMSRRRAVALALPALAWPVLARALVTRPPRAWAGILEGPVPRDDLPLRTVGLRSLGGAFRFDPPGLLISPGESVTWLNMGDFHTVTSFHPANAHLLSAAVPLRMPEDAEPFHSGMLGLDAGSVFEHEFTVEGVYDYFCQPHYSFGMVGRIVVGGPRGGGAVSGDDANLIDVARKELPDVATITGAAGRAWEWASRMNGVLLLRTRDADPGAAASAVLAAASRDSTLSGLLGRDGMTMFLDRLDEFAMSVDDGADYELLVQRADEAKRVLDVAANG